MSNHQKYGKKQFSLGQYYSQLQKYESGLNNSKSKVLKKDSSLTSFSKDAYKSTNSSKVFKQTIKSDKQKIIINERPSQKPVFEKFDTINLQMYKKSKINDERKFNSYLGQSLENSKVSNKKWPTQSANQEKQNIEFTAKQEKLFTEHCVNIYNLKNTSTIVQDMTRQINKRDEVYQLVANQFPNCSEQRYTQALQDYFKQHQLMKKIINEFKCISKLQTEDLNELYYFLKTDR